MSRKVDYDVVADLTCEGLSARQIAGLLDISERQVVRIRVMTGCAAGPPKHLSIDQIRTAERLIADGASIAEVARTIGIGEKSAQYRFAGRGWTVEQTGEFNRLRHEFGSILQG